MEIKVCDLYRNLVDEIQESLVYGVVTTFIKEKVKGRNNIIALKAQALRKAVDIAEYTIIFNSLMYITRLLRIKRRISPLLCAFLSSFYTIKRNGYIFAFKSSVFGLIMNILSSYI